MQPAFVRHADDRQAFADGFERGRRERVRHGEHRGGGVFREGMVTLGHAPGDVHVDDLVGPLRVASHQFVDQLRPAGIIHGVGDADLGQTALEALEVVGQPEGAALIDRHHFIDAVPEDETPVQDRGKLRLNSLSHVMIGPTNSIVGTIIHFLIFRNLPLAIIHTFKFENLEIQPDNLVDGK